MTRSTTLRSLLLTAILFTGLALESPAANLLANPGFASPPNGTTDWSLTLGASQGTPGTSQDRDGYVLVFREDQTPVSGWASAAQTLAAAPGQEWTFSAWAFYPSGMYLHEGDFALLDITFRSASGATASTQSPQVNLSLESTWQPLSQSAVAPADTTEVTLSAKFYRGDTQISGRLYFDNLSADATPPIPEPGALALLWPGVLWWVWRKREARGAPARTGVGALGGIA